MPEVLRRRLHALVLMVAGLAGTAWAQGMAVRDDAGQTLRLLRPPERIVSLLPALTESVCALGQCHRLVAVDRDSNWPVSIQHLPRMGGGLDFQLEAVVAQRPDLVLAAASSPGLQRLRSLGLAVLALEPRTHEDVQRVLGTLAQVLGLPQAQAGQLWTEIDAGVMSAAQSLPARVRGQRVYVEVGGGPFGASESSFIGQTLARLGQANILPASLGPFPQIQSEFVLRAQPDLIVIAETSRADLLRRPGWDAMGALRQGRICAFNPAQVDVLMRPGPRLAEAARLLAQCLQRTGGGS